MQAVFTSVDVMRKSYHQLAYLNMPGSKEMRHLPAMQNPDCSKSLVGKSFGPDLSVIYAEMEEVMGLAAEHIVPLTAAAEIAQ